MVCEIAGLKVLFKNKYPYNSALCAAYKSDGDAKLRLEVSEEEIAEERKRSAYDMNDGYLESVAMLRKFSEACPLYDRFLIHGAALEYGGDAVIFLGRSGAGKSTHAGLWVKYLGGAHILNGDKPFIDLSGDFIVVYGSPWQGKENIGFNGKGRLKGLCFIEQAKENSAELLTVNETAVRLLRQIPVPSDVRSAEKTLAAVDRIAREAKGVLLKCDISENAFKTAYSSLF